MLLFFPLVVFILAIMPQNEITVLTVDHRSTVEFLPGNKILKFNIA